MTGSEQLVDLPPEVLYFILCLLPIHTLSSLSKTNRSLNRFIDDFETCQHLWRIVGGKRWDLMESLFGYHQSSRNGIKHRDNSDLNLEIKNVIKSLDVGGNEKWDGKLLFGLQDLDNFDEHGEMTSATTSAEPKGLESSAWIPSQQIKRRSKAVKAVKKGAKDEVVAILNHTPTLQTLLSVMRTRRPRIIHQSHPNSSLPPSTTTQSLTSLFPSKSIVGDERWSKFVYPRETLTNLMEWGERLRIDDPSIKSRARDPPPVESEPSSNSKGKLPERRSARLSYNNYPIGLHSLLKNGLKPSEVDRLALLQVEESTRTLDEELAAQLHCLHGVREFSILPNSNLGLGDVGKDSGKRKKGRRDSCSSFSSVEDEVEERENVGTKRTKLSIQRNEESTSSSSNPLHQSSSSELNNFSEVDPNILNPTQTIISGGLLGNTQLQTEDDDDEDNQNQAHDADPPWYSLFDESNASRPFSLGSKNGGIGDSRLRTRARERTYDASRYAFQNGWGPFKPWRETRVDWARRIASDLVSPEAPVEANTKGNEEKNGNGKNSNSENDEPFVGIGTSDEEETQSQSGEEEEDQEALREEVEREFSVTPVTLASPPQHSETSTSQVDRRNIPSLASVLNSAVEASLEGYDELEDQDYQPDEPDLHQEPEPETENNPQELVLDPGDPEEDEVPTMALYNEDSDGEFVIEEDDFFDDGSDMDSDEEQGLHIGHFGATMASLREWAGSRVRREMEQRIKSENEKKLNQIQSVQGKGKGKAKEEDSILDYLNSPVTFQKTVDWLQLESIMLVTWSNLQSALRGGWGKGFELEIGTIGDLSAEPIEEDWRRAQDEADSHDAIKRFERRKRILKPRSDFENSRGEVVLDSKDSKSRDDGNDQDQDQDQRERREKENETEMFESSQKNESPKKGKEKEEKVVEQKPKDWANVEGTYVGTYSFLDFSDFLIFNAALGSQAQEAQAKARDETTSTSSNPTSQTSNVINPRSWLRSNTASLSVMRQAVSLEGKDEAVGDCLQLQLELLPLKHQPQSANPDFKSNTPDEQIEDLDGMDPNYPPLRFKGRTLTQNVPSPQPRGEAHGIVRPLYSEVRASGEVREIIALHWTIVHRYDGEDRWRLELVQPGGPGSRAPLYGTWSDANHEDGGPCGPASYYRVDSRRWQDREES